MGVHFKNSITNVNTSFEKLPNLQKNGHKLVTLIIQNKALGRYQIYQIIEFLS